VFAYHEPSKGLEPPNVPESELNPGKWRYYDYDLNAIREQIAKDISFARNLNP
jgi:hypothetical protein